MKHSFLSFHVACVNMSKGVPAVAEGAVPQRLSTAVTLKVEGPTAERREAIECLKVSVANW